MAVFRIEKTRDYTVMSNYHLRDMSLSLKAKGLLSLMLSLPENWDYTMKGLARICKDGIDSISGGIRELEAHGYLIRSRVRSANGQLGSIEYTILEQPKAPSPTQEKPIRENPVQANPMLDAPIQENPAQLNKEESSNYPSKTDLSITQESSPILSSPPAPRERIGQDGMRKRESYRALILENIEYDVLSQNVQLDKDRLDELVELMLTDYENEQNELNKIIETDTADMQRIIGGQNNVERFLKLVKKYENITELTPAMINEFIDKILVHEPQGKGADRTTEVEIYLNYVGQFQVPVEQHEPTEEERIAAEKEAERLRRKRESNRKYMKKIREKSKEFAEHERIAEEKSSDSNVCVEQNATSKSNRQKVKGEKIA